jgi:LuxR family transcriptional regulator
MLRDSCPFPEPAIARPFAEDELEMRLRTLTELSLLTLLRLEDEMVMPPEMKFSRRELEILKWTAEGKPRLRWR